MDVVNTDLQNVKEKDDTINKTPPTSKMTEEEIKQRLSQRAGEYFMFMDD